MDQLSVCLGQRFTIPSEHTHTSAGTVNPWRLLLPLPEHSLLTLLPLSSSSHEKPYSCPYCDKTFSYKPSMERHVQTHTGVAPYTCETCGQSFADSTQYKKHLITHGVTIVCDICNKSFADMASLKTHVRVHAGLDVPWGVVVLNKLIYLFVGLYLLGAIHWLSRSILAEFKIFSPRNFSEKSCSISSM